MGVENGRDTEDAGRGAGPSDPALRRALGAYQGRGPSLVGRSGNNRNELNSEWEGGELGIQQRPAGFQEVCSEQRGRPVATGGAG